MFRGGSLLPAIGSPVAGGTATRVLYVDSSGNLAGDEDLTFDGTTLTSTRLSIVGGTLTTDVRPFTMTATWNAAGVTFEGLLFTITDTASASGSLAMQILGGASGTTNLFKVDKNGNSTFGGSITPGTVGVISTGTLFVDSSGGDVAFSSNSGGKHAWAFRSGTLNLQGSSDAALGFTSAAADTALGGPDGTLDTAISRVSAGVLGVGTGAAGSVAGEAVAAAWLTGAAAAGATGARKIIKKVTGIADNTATDVFTVTVPNANHACAVKVTLLSSNGSTDAFESSRVATGTVVVARTTGVNAVAAVSTLEAAQIATVAAGATHTLAYGVSAISGAVGATNTFKIQVTIDDSGNLGSNQVVAVAELINAEATGCTIA